MPTPPCCCSKCNKLAIAGSRCGGCQIVLYCNAACQKAHWREHKPACRAGRALPFVSKEEALKTLSHVKAQHCSPAFQLREGPLRDVDLCEQGITLAGMPNLLAVMMLCGPLPLTNFGVMACVAERDGAWLPLLKVGNPLVPGVVQMECLDLGVDPSQVTIDAAKSAYFAGGKPVCPVYYSSRWQAYMNC